MTKQIQFTVFFSALKHNLLNKEVSEYLKSTFLNFYFLELKNTSLSKNSKTWFPWYFFSNVYF